MRYGGIKVAALTGSENEVLTVDSEGKIISTGIEYTSLMNAAFSMTFTENELNVSGELVVNHNLGEQVVDITVANSLGNKIEPDLVEYDSISSLTLTLASFSPLDSSGGDWVIKVMRAGGNTLEIAGGVNPGGFILTSPDGLITKKISLDNSGSLVATDI